MPLKLRKGFPPGGWQFYQPSTGWAAPNPMADSFDATVQKIINHHSANSRFNLPTDYNSVADLLDTFTCHRLKFDPHYCDGPEADKKKDQARPRSPFPSNKPSNHPPINQRVAKLALGLKRSATGGRILKDWLGSGGMPVSVELANKRANTCVTCPLNNMESDWFFGIPRMVAVSIHEQRRIKLQLELRVEQEDNLGTCDACGCHNPLKVWTPLKHILDHTPAGEFSKLHENCWIRKER